MGRKHRELNVFSASFLDVLCCALGGVILLVIAMSTQQKAETDQAQKQLRQVTQRIVEGYDVPVPLAVRADWKDRGTDIDLSVKGPDGKLVYYNAKSAPWGALLRDERHAEAAMWEVFCSTDPAEGQYEVFCTYYDGGSGNSFPVTGSVVLNPGDRGEVKRDFSTTLTREDKLDSGRTDRTRVARFSIRNRNGKPEITFHEILN